MNSGDQHEYENTREKSESLAESQASDDVDAKRSADKNVSQEMSNEATEENNPSIPEGYEDILGNGELLKKVLRPGQDNDTRPQRGWRTMINLLVRVRDDPDDKVITSLSGKDMEIFIGDSDSFTGIDLIIPLMSINELSRAIVSTRFAFGEKGLPEANIPPNSCLEVEVELLSADFVEEDSLEPQESLRVATKKKDRGNFWYDRGDFSTAIQCYTRAEKFLQFVTPIPDSEVIPAGLPEDIIELKDKLTTVKALIYNNLAAAQIKIDADRAALESVTSSLSYDPRNLKALYRRGQILSRLGSVDEALSSFMAALNIEPDNRLVSQEVSRLRDKRRQQYVKEKELYKKMIDGLKKGDPNDRARESKKWLSELVDKIIPAGSSRWALIGSSLVGLASYITYQYLNGAAR